MKEKLLHVNHILFFDISFITKLILIIIYFIHKVNIKLLKIKIIKNSSKSVEKSKKMSIIYSRKK